MKNLIFISVLGFFSSAVQANSTYLMVVDATEGTLARVETSQSVGTEIAVQSSILWNYEVAQASDDGSAVSSGRQQSAKSEYLVNCTSNSVALSGWKMFGDANATGQVLWADTVDGEPEFREPVRSAERALIKLACETKVAQR